MGNKLWLYIVENLILFKLFENIICFIKSDADFILISKLNLAVLPQVYDRIPFLHDFYFFLQERKDIHLINVIDALLSQIKHFILSFQVVLAKQTLFMKGLYHSAIEQVLKSIETVKFFKAVLPNFE